MACRTSSGRPRSSNGGLIPYTRRPYDMYGSKAISCEPGIALADPATIATTAGRTFLPKPVCRRIVELSSRQIQSVGGPIGCETCRERCGRDLANGHSK